MNYKFFYFTLIKWVFLAIFLLSFIGIGFFFFLVEYPWADFSGLWEPQKGSITLVFDDQGSELFRFERDRRDPIFYEKLPRHVIAAFVATEDHDFFQHSGFSLRGMIRSSLINLWRGRVVQGASTITQQVVRLLFLTSERTFLRKVHEIFLALQLERQWTKEQIFELYVNNIYFGWGIYGVEAACRRFWNKSVLEVTHDEAAILAAIAKSARFYSPLNAPLEALKRRNVVLVCMKNLGYLSVDECKCAQARPLVLYEDKESRAIRPYLKEWIRVWLEKKWGREAPYKLGLTIKLTINKKMQQEAERIFRTRVEILRSSMGPEINGGLLSIESVTGQIKAAVGGFDFKESEYNRCFQARRQMGSSFKPLLYALGVCQGIGLDTIFVDEPLEFIFPNGKVWRPKNWDNKFHGSMTLQEALTYSNNIVSIKLLQRIGIQNAIDLAKQCGITHALKPYLPLALGTAEVTMEENVAAFNIFANHGEYRKPYLIDRIYNAQGRKIWTAEKVKKPVFESWIVSEMVQALSQRMQAFKEQMEKRGWLDCESIGKTGSTNAAASVWFLGSTPSLTTAIYLGRDDNKPLGAEVFASKMVFPLWFDFNKAVGSTKKTF